MTGLYSKRNIAMICLFRHIERADLLRMLRETPRAERRRLMLAVLADITMGW